MYLLVKIFNQSRYIKNKNQLINIIGILSAENTFKHNRITSTLYLLQILRNFIYYRCF